MNIFESETIDSVYPELCQYILDHGEENSPRGLKTLDVGTVVISISEPWKRILTNKVRRINPFFLFAEFIWIVTRQNKVDNISFYNKKMLNFSDDGWTLNGAYGPRLMPQLPHIVNKIKLDPQTRQGVAAIFQPRDLEKITKDFPCNIMLHFIPRQGHLDMNVYVRSQDILLGLPYDFYHWSILQEMIASEVGLTIGQINWICGSFHGYERDMSIIQSIANSTEKDTILIEEPITTKLPKDLREIMNIEFKNRKSDISESDFRIGLEEIRNSKQDELIKHQLGALLYYRVRKKESFNIPREELLEATGCYAELLKFQNWDM